MGLRTRTLRLAATGTGTVGHGLAYAVHTEMGN